MAFTFLHTADWQIGKRFGAFPADKAAMLRDQRLHAVDRLAAAAMVAGAGPFWSRATSSIPRRFPMPSQRNCWRG